MGGLRENIIKLGEAYQYTNKQAVSLIDEIAEKTKDYIKRVEALNGVPEQNKKLLIETIKKERALLKGIGVE